MERPLCKFCEVRHWSWEPHAGTRIKKQAEPRHIIVPDPVIPAPRQDIPAVADNAVDINPSAVVTDIPAVPAVEETDVKAKYRTADGKFDKAAYQRDYMRRRREKAASHVALAGNDTAQPALVRPQAPFSGPVEHQKPGSSRMRGSGPNKERRKDTEETP